jgi:hypothetical protein
MRRSYNCAKKVFLLRPPRYALPETVSEKSSTSSAGSLNPENTVSNGQQMTSPSESASVNCIDKDIVELKPSAVCIHIDGDKIGEIRGCHLFPSCKNSSGFATANNVVKSEHKF